MSILKELSDVLKEVFWIKTSPKRKSSSRSKVTVRKTVKKISKVSKPAKLNKKPVEKKVKGVIPAKAGIQRVQSLDARLKRLGMTDKNKVGEITHYFDRINVCVVKITQGSILIGDKLTIVGLKSKFVQKVWSMQVESQDVKVAKKGQLIGVKVDKPVAVGDIVYK